MSTAQGTEQEVTEQEFVEALLSIIEFAFKLSFEECDQALFVATVNRNDVLIFKKIRSKRDKVRQDFAKKMLAHQESDEDDNTELFHAAAVAAAASTIFEKINDDIDTVNRFCDEQNVLSTQFETTKLISGARKLGGRQSLLA